MEFSDLLRLLDSRSQVRGRQFERICQWYLRHDPIYAAQLDDVWLWDEWPGRDGPDIGIDLVAREKAGRLWAIQAKAYDQSRTVRKPDIDSFLAASSRPEFSFRLLITTASDLSRNVRRQVKDMEPPVSWRLLSDLESCDLIWPNSPEQLKAPGPKPKKPREHQKEAIYDVLNGFKTSDRGQLIMACGTGKTLVGLWVAERLKAERTLILLPSLSLLSQVMEEWLLNGKGQPRVLAVCSDESVTKGADEWVSSTAELGYPVTTDPEAIAEELEQPGPVLVFATYHSSPRVAAAQRLTDAVFDLAVADEAHRCAGRVSSDFATILESQAIRAQKRLFMTATPRYFSGRVKKLAAQEELEIASMDDEARFGPVLHRLTFGKAIERDLLSPYQVVVIGVDDPTFKRYAERGQLVTRDGREITDARYLATQIALAKAMRDYDLKRTITFHGRVSRAREFAQDFPEVVDWMPEDDRPEGHLWCDHVSGKMPTSQRRARLDHLRGLDKSWRGILANAKCLGEGVDVPTLDGVAFIDPRRSQVDIVQNVGRAIRKAEDKQVGTILLPVFIDSDEDIDYVLSGSSFKPVFDVLRALRDHDDDLAQRLDSIRLTRDWGLQGPAPPWPDNIKFELPARVGARFARAFHARTLDKVAERPKLTIEQILAWADTHYDDSGEWPGHESGNIPGTLNENWAGVESALRLGHRGLLGGSSLARFLAKHRNARNLMALPALSVKGILGWADAHHERTGRWPTLHSGELPEAPGENWRKVDNALRYGRRQLPAGMSLARLLAKHRGVPNPADTRDLTIESILAWADAHHARTGSWPAATLGKIQGTNDETWRIVNNALRQGSRGLPGGSSLQALLFEHRDVRNRWNQPDLALDAILSWADAYHRSTGRWPARNSGKIRECPGETWSRVDGALRSGNRGLSGGSSLASLLAEKRGFRNRGNLPKLSIETILSWADAHHARTGSWPVKSSGEVVDSAGDTWLRINAALRAGNRGLPGGFTLARLLADRRGIPNRLNAKDFTIDGILSWAEAHHRRTGEWPKQSTRGPIEEAPGEKWQNVENALRRGNRGLPGGSTLTRLLDEHRRNKV